MIKDTLKTLETALKELADINTALDAALIVAITDHRGIITFANQRFCDISKYSREELLGQNHRIINSGYHSKEFFKEMWRTIANGKMWRGEIRNKAKDGTYYWMDTTIVPSLNEQGKPYQYVSFRIDITDRKHAEEMLLRSEKVAAVGQMASGIAHEIRNPLAAIKMTLHTLEPNSDGDRRLVELMLSELQRIDSIVDEFLLLAKPHAVHFQQHNLVDLLNTVVSLMRVQANASQIKIQVNVEPDIPEIRCDANQLKQVFVNLIKNAIEAMESGGEISITLKRLGERNVVIRFTDQGVGIPSELIPKLGEPFRTTKEKGTGMGLMVCQKIISDHRGTLQIESEVNQGTTVEVVLPLE